MPHLATGLCPALTKDIVDSLASINIRYCVDFVAADIEDVAKRSSVSYKDLCAIRKVLVAQYSAFPVSGQQHYEDFMSTVAILSVGCPSIDDILDGGVYTGEVTEVIGSAAAGKTQLCLSATDYVARIARKNVLYIDTSGNFETTRLEEMMIEAGFPEGEVNSALQRVRCISVFDIHELLDICETLKDDIAKQTDTFLCGLKLVIIDSVAAVLSPVIGGMQFEGLGLMMHLARALKFLAAEFSLAVLVTNNAVYGDGGCVRAALGKQWQTIPNTRLYLHTAQAQQQRHALLVKTSRQPLTESPVSFCITRAGLKSV